MFLGAADFQLAPIRYAKQKGYKIITCDNRPSNPGHKLATQSYDVSTIDKEAILKIAKKEKIDGILTYGSDISAPTVAYVAKKMNLPGNSIKSIDTLVSKKLFRKKIKQNISYKIFTNSNLALVYLLYLRKKPYVLKPIDSAGSKGVSFVQNPKDIDAYDLQKLIKNAIDNSITKTIIIEDYMVKAGKQICGDGFMFNGKLEFIYLGDGHFYSDRLAPWGETFPSTHGYLDLEVAKVKIEEILKKVKYNNGPFNVDLFILENGEPFINEIGPRNGGNFIPQVTKLATGVDMIEATVESCYDKNYTFKPIFSNSDYYYSSYMIHSKDREGKFKSIRYKKNLKDKIVLETLFINEGDNVNKFFKGNDAIGNLILEFESLKEMNEMYKIINEQINIKLI